MGAETHNAHPYVKCVRRVLCHRTRSQRWSCEIGHQSRPDHNVRASLPCCALLTMWKHQSNIITLPPSGFNLIRVTLFEKKSQQAVMHTSNTKYDSTTVWKIWHLWFFLRMTEKFFYQHYGVSISCHEKCLKNSTNDIFMIYLLFFSHLALQNISISLKLPQTAKSLLWDWCSCI